MRKLIYFIATSIDGFISRSDGSIDDFGFEGEHVQDLLNEYPETIPTHLRSQLNVTEKNRHFDTVLMGRHTYDVGRAVGVTSPYQHLDQYLFSTSIDVTPDQTVSLVNSDAANHVRALKAAEGLDIWLCGGPILASALIDEIDEIILKINPFFMGVGKTLFARDLLPNKPVRIIERRDYSNGFALVRYEVIDTR